MTNSDSYQNELNQERFGLKVAALLSAASTELPHDISERLRAARVQALARRKVVALHAAGAVLGSSGAASLSMGDDDFKWWNWVGSALPMIALLVGLVTISIVQRDNRAVELAEVDVALLTDDLPPSAYTDPGFTQFLKSLHDDAQ